MGSLSHWTTREVQEWLLEQNLNKPARGLLPLPQLEKVNIRVSEGQYGAVTLRTHHLNNNHNRPIQKCAGDLNRHFSKEYIQMPRKQIKRCLTSLVINGNQIKTTVKYHFISIRRTIIKTKNQKKANVSKGCGKLKHLCVVLENVKMMQLLWKWYDDSWKN